MKFLQHGYEEFFFRCIRYFFPNLFWKEKIDYAYTFALSYAWRGKFTLSFWDLSPSFFNLRIIKCPNLREGFQNYNSTEYSNMEKFQPYYPQKIQRTNTCTDKTRLKLGRLRGQCFTIMVTLTTPSFSAIIIDTWFYRYQFMVFMNDTDN